MTGNNTTKREKFPISRPLQCPAEMCVGRLQLERRKKYGMKILKEIERRKKEARLASTFRRLAQPKPAIKVRQPSKTPCTLTENVKKFKVTTRLIELSLSNERKALQVKPTLSEALIVKKSALKYNATPRIQELALPKVAYEEVTEFDPFKVSPRALTAKVSANIGFLARPKTRIDHHVRKHPFNVKKRALRAKASARIKELAIPKTPMSETSAALGDANTNEAHGSQSSSLQINGEQSRRSLFPATGEAILQITSYRSPMSLLQLTRDGGLPRSPLQFNGETIQNLSYRG